MSDSGSTEKHLSGAEGLKKIGELIDGIHIGMLTTSAGDGTFDSRPMGVRTKDFDGTLWFLTKHESGKVREIEHDARVGLIFAEPADTKYVAIKGHASVSEDKAKIHELWSPMMNAWFPGGEEDPSIAVIEVKVSEAQYWEASSSKLVLGVKYLAAAVTGGKVDVGETGKITV
jgi:general stress protein 26